MVGTSALLTAVMLSGQVFAAQTHPGPGSSDSTEVSLGGSVSRATFTRAVVNHEPVDFLTQTGQTQQHLYFFSELKGLTGDTVTHRWEVDGNVVAEIPFAVGGPKWRVWSSYTINRKGTWIVRVVNAKGVVLQEKTLASDPLNLKP